MIWKKDVQGKFTRGLVDLKGITPILYKWNKESGMQDETVYAGFSAQDIQAHIPEAVGLNPDGYLTLQDRPILATLVNAVNDLREENEILRSRLAKLEENLK